MHDESAEAAAVNNDDARAARISNDAWLGWLQSDVRSCAAYATHGAILEECCAVAAAWRDRFWERKTLWSRIRHGRRLAKELAEIAPVIAAVRAALASTAAGGRGFAADAPKATIIDLCSGFGYLGMFLSELLPRADADFR